MKYILPEYGVEVIEVPRLRSKDGEVINATCVRKWLHENNWEKMPLFLPETTMDYLRSHTIQWKI